MHSCLPACRFIKSQRLSAGALKWIALMWCDLFKLANLNLPFSATTTTTTTSTLTNWHKFKASTWLMCDLEQVREKERGRAANTVSQPDNWIKKKLREKVRLFYSVRRSVCQHSVTSNRWVAADALQCSNSVVHTLPTPTLFLPTLSVCFQSIHSLTKWCDYPIWSLFSV